jgi:hypothetical protein
MTPVETEVRPLLDTTSLAVPTLDRASPERCAIPPPAATVVVPVSVLLPAGPARAAVTFPL